MANWNNFVQNTVNSAIAFGDTSILINAAVAPWEDPPVPDSGSIGYLTITDSLTNPTNFEIISYTGRAGFGPFTLSGITRGLENTTPRNWDVGAYIIQYMTSAQVVDTNELATSVGDVMINGGEF